VRQDQDGGDAHRLALLGHSDGGLIALDLASRLKADEAPEPLVLAATPGRPLNDVLRDQLERLLGEPQATPAQRRFLLAANDRISTTIRETGKVPNDVQPGLAALYSFSIGP